MLNYKPTRKKKTLVLYFSRGTTLSVWEESGSIEREYPFYKKYLDKDYSVTFVTNGDRSEQEFFEKIPGVSVVYNKYGLPETLYRFYIGNIFPKRLTGNCVIKCQQPKGAEIARAASLAGKMPFFARCGYMHSDFSRFQFGESSRQYLRAKSIEGEVLKSASRISVTLKEMQESIYQQHGIGKNIISILPNFVDTQLFKPVPSVAKREGSKKLRILFVGSLKPQKNCHNFLKSMTGLDVEIDMVAGWDGFNGELQTLAKNLNLDIKFHLSLGRTDLAKKFQKADVFVLPSYYESMCKSILEALSSGLPVIAGNGPGTREVITHEKTGLLCGFEPEEIREQMQRLMSDSELREKLGSNARKYVCDNFTLEKVFEEEEKIVSSLMAGQ